MQFHIQVRVEIICAFKMGATIRNDVVWYLGAGGDSLWFWEGYNNAKQCGLIFGYGGRYFVAQQCSPNSTGIWNTNWTCNLPLRKRTTYQEFPKGPWAHINSGLFTQNLKNIAKLRTRKKNDSTRNLNENWVLGLLKKTSWLNVQAAGGESLWF